MIREFLILVKHFTYRAILTENLLILLYGFKHDSVVTAGNGCRLTIRFKTAMLGHI